MQNGISPEDRRKLIQAQNRVSAIRSREPGTKPKPLSALAQQLPPPGSTSTAGATEIERYLERVRAGQKNENAHRIEGNLRRWKSIDWQHHSRLINAKRVIVDWSKLEAEQGGGLIIAGDPGCGKTMIAQAIAEARGPLARFVNEIDLVQKIQASYSIDALTVESLLLPLQQTPLLIYDDLGAYETNNLEWLRKIYYAVFNGRQELRKATLITTNLPLEDHAGQSPLQDWLGGRIFSRLMGQVEKLDHYIDLFGVPDYRLRNFS